MSRTNLGARALDEIRANRSSRELADFFREVYGLSLPHGMLWGWYTGRSTPNAPHRVKIERATGIPVMAWDEEVFE